MVIRGLQVVRMAVANLVGGCILIFGIACNLLLREDLRGLLAVLLLSLCCGTKSMLMEIPQMRIAYCGDAYLFQPRYNLST